MRFVALIGTFAMCLSSNEIDLSISHTSRVNKDSINIGAGSAGFFVTHLPQELRKDIDLTQFGDLVVLDNNSTSRSSLVWLHGHGSSGASVSNMLGKGPLFFSRPVPTRTASKVLANGTLHSALPLTTHACSLDNMFERHSYPALASIIS